MTRLFRSLDDEEFNQLFRDFRFTAYRLETLQHYDVSYERDELNRFLAGQARGEFPGIAEWCEGVRAAVAAGKWMHRVHMVTQPLSDYVRFECSWAYEHTVDAGEDVRLIPVNVGAWPSGLPHHDYWLFDSSRLVVMHYDQDGAFVSGEVVSDPDRIVAANYWRDLAVHLSMPYREFASRLELTAR